MCIIAFPQIPASVVVIAGAPTYSQAPRPGQKLVTVALSLKLLQPHRDLMRINLKQARC